MWGLCAIQLHVHAILRIPLQVCLLALRTGKWLVSCTSLCGKHILLRSRQNLLSYFFSPYVCVVRNAKPTY